MHADHKKAAALAVQLAKDDPALVKAFIARLRESGEVGVGDIRHLDRIANRWLAISEGNRLKGTPR